MKTKHSTELVVALDFAEIAPAEALMKQLSGLSVIYKVGLELFLAAGPQWVKGICDQGVRVFLDLKFHDIPNTVAAAVAQAHGMGVEFTTVHLSGGSKMLDAIEASPNVLGVSVLTSYSEEQWKEGVLRLGAQPFSIENAVIHFSKLAQDHLKVYGMVCSPHELGPIRARYPDLFLLVPGIRPEGSLKDDQARVMTPREAARAGASAIVVGRPIIKASDPRTVVENILLEIQ